jgi:predicted DNA-binding transcriptional regulator YafY
MVKIMGDSQVARLLDLVPYLTLNQGVALDKIAEDFSTSKSEILADLNTLWMCGLPGYTPLELIDLSFDTGFVSIRNAEILSNPRKLSNAEVGAIIIGLSIIRDSIPENSAHSSSIKELLARLSMKSQLSVPEIISTGIPTDTRNMIYSAMKMSQNIYITYHSSSRDEISTREIIPFSLSQEGNNEYVHSYCYTTQDFRVFRLDRISEIRKSERLMDASLTEDRNIEDGYEYLIRVLSNARKIAEIFQVRESTKLHAGVEFSKRAYNSEWIVRTICSLRGSAEIVEPLVTREAISTRAQKALNLYS